MKQKIMLKALVLAAVSSLGLASAALAENTPTTSAVSSPDSLGLLGQTYAGLTYSYVHLDNSPVNAGQYGFEYNQPMTAGFDAIFNYDRTQNDLLAGDRAYGQSFDAALRAFSTAYSWGKPYLEAGVGYDWMKFAGMKDHSFAWIAGTGIEFQATSVLTITPFLRYAETNGFSDHHYVDYGVKANYWVTRRLALTAAIDRNDSQDMSYKFGFNVHF
jgi:hypothetical protein